MWHKIFWLLNLRSKESFLKDSFHLERTQRRALEKILSFNSKSIFAKKNKIDSNISYESFQKDFPITNYSDWKDRIEQQRADSSEALTCKVKRFQGTSGSTESTKWIPYNTKILQEFDAASSPWLADLGKEYPRILKGKHYWSLSWIPDHLRGDVDSDDSQLLPFWKRFFMSKMMIPNPRVARAKTSDDCMFATLVSLVLCKELSLISVWSPTFALHLIELLIEKKELILLCNEKGSWRPYSNNLDWLDFPKKRNDLDFLENISLDNIAEMTAKLWPKLGLVSSWDTSTSEDWAKKLQSYFPHACFQGKGLWATEGVISFPFEKAYPLAFKGHFFEFECSETKEILPSWKLEKGMTVLPILTTGNGILRYKIEDLLYVSGFFNEVPCFQFLGRNGTVDMVGEKLDIQTGEKIIKKLGAFCLLAIKAKNTPYYALILERKKQQEVQLFEEALALELEQNYHYKLARDLGQLGESRVFSVDDALGLYLELMKEDKKIVGNIKVEPLSLVSGEVSCKLVESLNV